MTPRGAHKLGGVQDIDINIYSIYGCACAVSAFAREVSVLLV